MSHYSQQQQSRLFDRSSYLPRTISVYQIVGAYLVDIYYNHLYAEAHKFRGKGDVPTVTEGYRHSTFAFLSGLDHNAKATYKAQHYKQLLIGVNEYFKTWTSFNTLTVSDCIDKIVREFVPDDYFKELDKDQKSSILRMVLTDTLREFTKVVVGEFLSAIVDNHDEPANIEALKDRIVDLMISEREKMFHKFLASHFPASNETVDKKFAEKMRDEIVKLQAERDQLKTFAIKQQEEIEVRKDQLAKVVAKFRKMEAAYKRIIEEYKVSKEAVADLEHQVQEYERNKTRMEELESSEFMSGGMDDVDVSKSEMDELIAKHTVQTTQPVSKPEPKVAVKTNVGTLAPALPTQINSQINSQRTVSKPVSKPVPKPVTKVQPIKVNKPEESEESEEEESEEEEDEPSSMAVESIRRDVPVIPKIKPPTNVSISSLANPPKSPKSDIGSAPKLLDDY